jgi:hypothetical protein
MWNQTRWLTATPTVLLTVAKDGMSWGLWDTLRWFHSMKPLTAGRYREKIKNTNTWRLVPLDRHHLLVSTPSSNRWFRSPLPHHHHSIHYRRHSILLQIYFHLQTRRGRCHPGSLPRALLLRSIRTETCTMMAPSTEAHISLQRQMQRATGTPFF